MSTPMTPIQFETKMQEICNGDDIECDHEDADALLCQVLGSLGYGAGVDIFDNAAKWYG